MIVRIFEEFLGVGLFIFNSLDNILKYLRSSNKSINGNDWLRVILRFVDRLC
jgi:hypothetical protein